jgi:hypothetical protein
MELAFSDSVMRVSPSVFKADIARNLFLMILVKFQHIPWPGFNLRALLPKAVLPKPLQSSRTRLLSVSNSNLLNVLRLFCHIHYQPFFWAVNERNHSSSCLKNHVSKDTNHSVNVSPRQLFRVKNSSPFESPFLEEIISNQHSCS